MPATAVNKTRGHGQLDAVVMVLGSGAMLMVGYR